MLLGHIQLHRLQQPEQAAISYGRVLKGEVDATIAALAEQGLFKDPFLNTDPDQTGQHRLMWSPRCRGSPVMRNPGLYRSGSLSHSGSSPGSCAEPRDNCHSRSQFRRGEARTRTTAEEPPLDTIEPAPQPQEPAVTKLLEHSWLRVQLQPDIKSPTDSVEPMGLINRIKGVFARSAGR